MKSLISIWLAVIVIWLGILAIVISSKPHPSPKIRRGEGVRFFETTPIPQVSLLTTGDVLLARTINAKSVKDANFDWPFAHTQDLLSTPDLTFVNLETPLLADCPVITSGFKFCGSNQNIPALVRAGIDIVNLANNHSGNFGQTGLAETITALQAANLRVTGTSDPAFVTTNGIRFGFLGFDDTISPVKQDQFTQLIHSATSQSDHVIVAIHWGIEYQNQPSARQILLGHLAIDSGASLVVGHHLHWIQPIEQYRDGYIYYSHGNFIFDQFWSEATKTGLVITTTFSKAKIMGFASQTIYITPPGIPQLLSASGGN